MYFLGHVLGLVGVNGDCAASCNPASGVNSAYECDGANAEYSLIDTSTLFLENNGGPGTACGHWEENSFRTSTSSELMTGFFEPDLFQPLYTVHVAALNDLGGNEVDYCGADILPATADNFNRWDVSQTTAGMTAQMTDAAGDGMGSHAPLMGINPDGEMLPIGDSGNTDDTFDDNGHGTTRAAGGISHSMSLQ